jgi:hypothetical protein
MEELIFDKMMDGVSLVKDILETHLIGSIRDDKGNIYLWYTIDKTKNYQVRKYEYYRALQPYSVTNYEIQVI